MTKKINQMAVRFRSLADGDDVAFKWESSLDKILTAGNYAVEIEHYGADVGLPIEGCGTEHSIVGTLVVTDSGALDNKQGDRVMGQVLTFTLRESKETSIYTRTYAGGEWGEWCSLARTGMYDEITNADALYSTVTTLAGATKELEKNLQASIINYNEWKGSNAELSLPNVLADDEFVKIVKSGTILTFKSTSTTWKRFQYTAASAAAADVGSYSNWKELSGAAYGIKQSVDAGKVQISTTGENGAVKDILNIVAATTEKAGVMTAADKAKLNNDVPYPQETGTIVTSADKRYIYRGSGDTDVVAGLYWQAWPKTVDLRVKKWGMSTNDEVSVLSMPAATTENAGVMSAADKKMLNDNEAAIETEVARAQSAEAAAIEQGRKLALRDLFVAAGALYNNTGADITRIAPWGESVTHKDGHYYLNGLGDITEKEMDDIYAAPHRAYSPHSYSYQKNRTVFCQGNGASGAFKSFECYFWFFLSNIESVGGANDDLYLSGDNVFASAFNGCAKLKYVNFLIYCQGCKLEKSFKGCRSLMYVRLSRLSNSLSFSDSPDIAKESILYVINNAVPSMAISITLHADAYARLKEDSDIITALEAQPLVSLVSA